MKTTIKLFFLGVLWIAALPATAATEYRTAKEPVGRMEYPSWLFDKQEHDEFRSERHSNTDSQHDHPQQWEGQDWDPAAWGASWTPDEVINRFFNAGIFKRVHMKNSAPTVELGPTFYKLSDLDRRRTLKLLTDQARIFETGYAAVLLTDWWTHDVVGSYTAKGLFLN